MRRGALVIFAAAAATWGCVDQAPGAPDAVGETQADAKPDPGGGLPDAASEMPQEAGGEEVAPLADPGDDAVTPPDIPSDPGPDEPETASADVEQEDSAAGPWSLRVMAANLSSGDFQSYDPGHGERILKGLEPDLVLIQEFNYGANTQPDLRDFVDSALGPEFDFVRGAGAIPNGVISRWPIVDAGAWDSSQIDNRDFDWARIDVPGDKDLLAVSVHFSTQSTKRKQEGEELAGHLAAVDEDVYLVLAGDLNTNTRVDTVPSFAALLDIGAPYPADRFGVEGTNADRSKPYDWVLHGDALGAWEVPVVIGANEYPAGLVFDSRVYAPLSDVAPVLLGDSGADGMQHMAVLKDFLVP